MPDPQFAYGGDDLPPLPADPEEAAMVAAAPVTVGDPRSLAPVNGIPMFETVSRRLPDGTYQYVEMVSVLTPGDKNSIPRMKVTETIKRRYAPWYRQWKEGQALAPVGTPLEMWAYLLPAQVRDLKSQNVFTVEQLAEVADANLHRIPMGQHLRDHARAYIAEKTNADAIAARQKENEDLKTGMSQLQNELAELRAQLEARARTDVVSSPAAVPEIVTGEGGAVDPDAAPATGGPPAATAKPKRARD